MREREHTLVLASDEDGFELEALDVMDGCEPQALSARDLTVFVGDMRGDAVGRALVQEAAIAERCSGELCEAGR